jgi:hypothetical protein
MIQLQPRLFRALDAGGVPAVQSALQSAIELEHSTIPVYLYALYSLDPEKNGSIAAIITSVVIEEMLHMTLACNVLNALGGSPEIDRPGFVPTYPGPLPGGIDSELIVHLAPFSRGQLAAFMKIEEPDDPLHFPVVATRGLEGPRTIGQFYTDIKRQIALLGDGAFSSIPRNQVGPDLMYGSVVVTSVATAEEAIDVIIEQGEGTRESPLEAATGEVMAHYYRYAEISYGRKLIPNPDANPETPPDRRYLYGGGPIAFDESAVYAVPTDPLASSYAPGSASRHACDTFNYAYTSLLKALHATFNGQPDQINSAIGLMMSLKQLARDMMSGSNPSGVNVGPSFEYQPIEP